LKRAFTLIELLVVIAIIAVLAAILFPVFASAKLAAKKTVEISNLKQVGTAYAIYETDHDEAFPLHSFPTKKAAWPVQIQPYLKSWQLLHSPFDRSKYWASSGTNPPTADSLESDSVWNYRWTSYLVNAYLTGGIINNLGDKSIWRNTGAVNAPSNLIQHAVARDDVAPHDHFHPFYWGNPSEWDDNEMEGITWDQTRQVTKELMNVSPNSAPGTYLYVDTHVKVGHWSQVYWRDLSRSIYCGNFDPRNEGR
jgi:prepilin-type N-terminal cleavage/methylation domain-containing protein